MSAVSKRVYKELQIAKAELMDLRQENNAVQAENAGLQAENQNLRHQCHLAYLEGVDQGRASAFQEVG